MHAEWCGHVCADCAKPCYLDTTLPCSPDCENLREDGTPDPEKCKGCEVCEVYEDGDGGVTNE